MQRRQGTSPLTALMILPPMLSISAMVTLDSALPRDDPPPAVSATSRTRWIYPIHAVCGATLGCFILSTNVTNVALGAETCFKAYLAAGFAAYLLGGLVCFLRWRRASNMKHFSWILAVLAIGFTSCLHASEELVGVSIR